MIFDKTDELGLRQEGNIYSRVRERGRKVSAWKLETYNTIKVLLARPLLTKP